VDIMQAIHEGYPVVGYNPWDNQSSPVYHISSFDLFKRGRGRPPGSVEMTNYSALKPRNCTANCIFCLDCPMERCKDG
jgi:hypothetical protein